jgi:hypothetical protein
MRAHHAASTWRSKIILRHTRGRGILLSSDYSEIKIRLKFVPELPAPNVERDWNLAPTRLSMEMRLAL